MSRFGFIGCGNMGGALALAAAKAVEGSIVLSDHHPDKVEALCAQTGATAGTNEEIAAHCDFIFLGVKPQVLRSLLTSLAPILKSRKDPFVLVSMAAGIPLEEICSMAGGEYPVIVIKPNTPAAVGEGMIQYCKNGPVTQNQEQIFLDSMKYAGKLDELSERALDAAGSLSGCGPAFACLFLEALADGGVKCGLPRDKAIAYAAQTLIGTGKLVLDTKKHPGLLKDEVCSPGGSTIAGVYELEQAGFRAAVISAVSAAFQRTKELGKS